MTEVKKKRLGLVLGFAGVLIIVYIFISSLNIILGIDYGINIFQKLTNLSIWAILFLTITLTFLNIFNDYRLKKRGFNPFKHHDKVSEADIFVSEVLKLPTYKKVIKSNNGFILIDEAGLFEVRFVYGKGILKGNINDEAWYINTKQIINPFKLKRDDITRYLVLTGGIVYSVFGVKLVSKSSLIFALDKHLNKRVLNQEQIDKEYELYGDNQN